MKKILPILAILLTLYSQQKIITKEYDGNLKDYVNVEKIEFQNSKVVKKFYKNNEIYKFEFKKIGNKETEKIYRNKKIYSEREKEITGNNSFESKKFFHNDGRIDFLIETTDFDTSVWNQQDNIREAKYNYVFGKLFSITYTTRRNNIFEKDVVETIYNW
ncbi:MAG: hypothetical protein AB7V77_00770 [Candidatus Woesearchaeota archaeon]